MARQGSALRLVTPCESCVTGSHPHRRRRCRERGEQRQRRPPSRRASPLLSLPSSPLQQRQRRGAGAERQQPQRQRCGGSIEEGLLAPATRAKRRQVDAHELRHSAPLAVRTSPTLSDPQRQPKRSPRERRADTDTGTGTSTNSGDGGTVAWRSNEHRRRRLPGWSTVFGGASRAGAAKGGRHRRQADGWGQPASPRSEGDDQIPAIAWVDAGGDLRDDHASSAARRRRRRHRQR